MPESNNNTSNKARKQILDKLDTKKISMLEKSKYNFNI